MAPGGETEGPGKRGTGAVLNRALRARADLRGCTITMTFRLSGYHKPAVAAFRRLRLDL